MAKLFLYALFGFFVAVSSLILVEIYTMSVSAAFNKIRPIFIKHGGEECLDKLARTGVKFVTEGVNRGEKDCPIFNAVKVTSFSQTAISRPQTLTCPTALAVNEWMTLANLSYVKVDGSYNCRKARNSRIASEHSYGTAIDVYEVDGASVLNDWGKPNDKGQKLRLAYEAGCKVFSNSLSPEYNALHKNHFHFDMGMGAGCTINDLINDVWKSFRKLNY